FNPVEQNTGRRLQINVEDVTAYVQFIKSTVGITHEDELVKAIEILAQKVHPLALGNVERFLSQSRMIARKILRTHMQDADDHIINDIVENMASKLYFHGHPINRQEAKDDLKLKVVTDLQPDLERSMWDLYKDFEAEFENQEAFNPASELSQLPAGPAPAQIDCELVHAMVESERLSSKHSTRRRFTLLQVMPQMGQQVVREDILEQGWNHSPVP
ncbi:MAG: hypothetical protein ACRD2L_00235, partial [Terriglobia bacterium]